MANPRRIPTMTQPGTLTIDFADSVLTPEEQRAVTEGFRLHSEEQRAPHFVKHSMKWIAKDDQGEIKGVLTADVLWDWMYVDELWVDRGWQGRGVATSMMQSAERYAFAKDLEGLWLWTQSWQAAGFYEKLGYAEFTRFENFPKGHSPIGFRKRIKQTA